MNKDRWEIVRRTAAILMFCVVSLAMADGNEAIPIRSWLALGPVTLRMPVFHETPGVQGNPYGLKDALQFQPVDLDGWWPAEGDGIPWAGMEVQLWRQIQTDDNGIRLLSAGGSNPEISYLAAFCEVNRYIRVTLTAASHHLMALFIDGKPAASKDAADPADKEERGSLTHSVSLETGKHLILIKAMRDPKCEKVWDVQASLSVPQERRLDVALTVSPARKMTIDHLLDGPKVSGASISPDGELATVTITARKSGEGSESWLELRRVRDGRLVQTFRGGMRLSSVQWAPSGKRFTYVEYGEKSTLWLVDLEAGTSLPVLENVKNLQNHVWSPDGTYIAYSISEDPKPSDTGVKLLEGMPDRWPWFGTQSFIYRVSIPQGISERLTAGSLETNLNSISPDGQKILFSRNRVDFTQRPYSVNEFYLFDLKNWTVDTLFVSLWINTVQWAPDGKRLLVAGGPLAFDGIGNILPHDVVANDYDVQAYIYDLSTGSAEPVTKTFDPSIQNAVWSKTENCIWFQASDKAYSRLYRYDLKTRIFQAVETSTEVISGLDFADSRPLAVYTGSGINSPAKAYVLDLKGKSRPLSDPEEEAFAHVGFGHSERWTFINSRGTEIDGHVYYPPDFSPDRKYPCIVYYYGGTTPVTRDFGGRYPKEFYAANGYVVYVLQPSGAIGYGQTFSALHVNDWGRIVAEEIIQGTRLFLDAHPFVDRDRVGCMGASYGGFMTMLLVSKTNIFKAAIAHAGISSISSYWGEGYWGYLYSSTATANSFPWNRKDIYVDQSPLFRADQIHTPLLLTHGGSDTNVPPGESIQLYTALKLLGREVELMQVEGQDHFIIQYPKRVRWLKSIIAWFDRWLKDQPQWWEDLYPKH